MKAIKFFLKISGVERLNPFSKIQGVATIPTPSPPFSAPGSMLLIGDLRICSSEIFLKIIQLGVF